MRAKMFMVFLGLAFLLGSLIVGAARGEVDQPQATLLKPDNISCQGWERTTVIVGWKDTSTGENGFKLERSDNGGAWSEIQTHNPNGNGEYDVFKDTGTDVTHSLRYRIRAYEGSNYGPYSDVCDNRRIYDPQNFRIFYGLRGTSDDCPLIDGWEVCLANTAGSGGGSGNKYVDQQASTLQGSADAFFRLGFTRRADQPTGGLDKVPINIVWCDGGGCAGGGGIGLSPFMVEKDFNLSTRVGDPIPYLVPLHELWHFLQGKYYHLNDPNDRWIIEGQARSIQDKVCIGAARNSALCFDDIATGDAGYVPQVNNYLGNPNVPITAASYNAALFWTYLVEKYGTSNPGDQAEAGMNFMLEFWKASENNPGLDGIGTINKALQAMGYTQRFRDIFQDFAVASYAKDFNSASAYRYDDMLQTGGSYNPVMLSTNTFLNLGDSYLDTDESVYNWGAKYYQFRPASNVPLLDIKVTQDTPTNLYYTVQGIRGNSVVWEYNLEARNLNYPLLNDSYDKVAVIVVGLENIGNYRISVNGTQPSLNILRPTVGNKARVGSMTAPDKFILQVEVVDGSGVPLAGVNLDNFSFIVGEEGSGGVTIPAGNIINKYSLMAQNWFVLRAPSGLPPDTDGTPNTYRLTVRYGTALSDNEDDALDYTPRNNADNVILLDKSGSMGAYNKLMNAANAAKLFIDSWRTGDKFGLISFTHQTFTDMQVTDWTDTPSGGSRQQAFNWLDGYTASGGTRIGDTIWAGFTELQARGDPSHDWALVLLSDGIEEHPGTRPFDKAIDDLVKATGKKPVIHTVAVGPNADRPRMQAAASRTGGTYQYVTAPVKMVANLNLAQRPIWTGSQTDLEQILAPQDIPNMGLAMDYRYRTIATDIIGQQQFFALVGPFNQSQDVINIPIESGAAEVVLSLSWDGLIGSRILRDPNGSYVSPFESDYRHSVWRLSTPMGGVWTLEINEYIIPKEGNGAAAPSYLPPYLVQASIKTDVTMDAFIATPPEDNGYGHLQLPPGRPVTFVASLSDNAPITSALVRADVENPYGGMTSIWMWDDGNHQDGQAGDGVFASTHYQTGMHGSYNVTILALGYSPSLNENFFRSKLLSFHVARVDQNGNEILYQDLDGDGLPDDWERYFLPFTDPSIPDLTADPDADGSTNETEWVIGTNPGDPDTDHDGEADGTDPFPLDPTLPSVISPPSISAYPGVGEVFVRYTFTDTTQTVDLYRDEDDDLDAFYSYLGSHTAPGLPGIYTDTAVINGRQYCYVAVAFDNSGRRSTTSAPSCAVPNTDPLPPHGAVRINAGEQSTNSPNVSLDLWATDSVDPEVHDFGPDFTPPADSATQVTHMMVSNDPSFAGAAWEAYANSKPWTLGQTSGLATVYVRYRDATGNVSETAVATIWIGRDPATKPIFLPLVIRR